MGPRQGFPCVRLARGSSAASGERARAQWTQKSKTSSVFLPGNTLQRRALPSIRRLRHLPMAPYHANSPEVDGCGYCCCGILGPGGLWR